MPIISQWSQKEETNIYPEFFVLEGKAEDTWEECYLLVIA